MPPNIECIITAEFDADQGPKLSRVYPTPYVDRLEDLNYLPELMLPDQIHTRDEDYTLFLLYRNPSKGLQYVCDADCDPNPFFLYTIIFNWKDGSAKRGTVVKSLSILTQLPFFEHFYPILQVALDLYFKSGSATILLNLYNSLNRKPLNVTNVSLVRKLLLTSMLDAPLSAQIYSHDTFRHWIFGNCEQPNLFLRKDLSYNSITTYERMDFPLKVPMFTLPDTIGDYFNPTDLNFRVHLMKIMKASLATNYLHGEITIYGLQTPSLIILINAMITGKRVLILSYENAAGIIIDFVKLIIKIVTGGGILSGFLSRYNVFPMIDVSKVEILEKCESFLAGTINPFFKHNEKLWDVLYDLDTNSISLSLAFAPSQYPSVEKAKRPSKSRGPLSSFMPSYSPVPGTKPTFEPEAKRSIIAEDAKFLSSLQLSLFRYNDDLTTLQMIFRRHINEIARILTTPDVEFTHPNTRYFWPTEESREAEFACYLLVAKKFQLLLTKKILVYNLDSKNAAQVATFQYQLQYLDSCPRHSSQTNEFDAEGEGPEATKHQIWHRILKSVNNDHMLESLLLATFLMPTVTCSTVAPIIQNNIAKASFAQNCGIQLLLSNLFNLNDTVKANVAMIVQQMQQHVLCGWYVDRHIKANMMYALALLELSIVF